MQQDQSDIAQNTPTLKRKDEQQNAHAGNSSLEYAHLGEAPRKKIRGNTDDDDDDNAANSNANANNAPEEQRQEHEVTPPPIKMSPGRALAFKVLKTHHKARAGTLTLPHGDVLTPVYMPVGTKGAIKGLTSEQMRLLDCRILLANTYHLASKPTGEYLESVGGLHKFMNWDRNILTDSGGFQMVSLSKLCEVTEQGVHFQNPYDQKMMFLRPEDSMHTQNQIGSDIMMALDDVVKPTSDGNRMSEACDRTIRWMNRNIAAHARPDVQNLYPIVQGGLDTKLRQHCLKAFVELDAPGYAIGGLAGGEQKDDFWRMVDLCTDYLPRDKPRYLMGVGYPVDLVVCACLGVDQFDCVFSTRTARFGTAFVKEGFLRLNSADMKFDFGPIDKDCGCETCQNYTRAFIYQIIKKEETACHMLTIHNLYYLLNLMRSLRQSILDERLPEFVNDFLFHQYKKDKQIPQWVLDAMNAAKIDVKIEF